MEFLDLIFDEKDIGTDEVWTCEGEVLILCGFAATSKRILEIGTQWGRTTINLAKASPPDAIIWTIDKDPKPTLIGKFEWANKIRFFQGDSLTFDFAAHGVSNCDLIFVDGCHEDFMFGADTRLAFSLISSTGKIVWHDHYDDSCRGGFVHIKSILEKLGLPIVDPGGMAVLDLAKCYPVQARNDLETG